MVLQKVGSEVLYGLVYYLCLFVNSGVVDFGFFHACAHERDGTFIVHLICLSEYSRKKVVGGEGV